MITAEAMKPLGLAVKDFYAGDVAAEVTMHRDDGTVHVLSVSGLFRGPLDFQVDKVLLDECSGKILDVGAGVGIHSQFLQQKGFSVHALDVSPECCKVMQRRGVKNVICGSILDVKGSSYDTLLILGRSITLTGTLEGLDEFLQDARRLVNPGGRILLNSLDVARATGPKDKAYQRDNRKAGRYIGEIRHYLEYKGVAGPPTLFLHVDDVTLTAYAAAAGWSCKILLKEKDGNYAARLEKIDK